MRTIRLARRAVTVMTMSVRGLRAVTAAGGMREARAERAHTLKNQGEGKQQLERDAFHAGLLYAQ